MKSGTVFSEEDGEFLFLFTDMFTRCVFFFCLDLDTDYRHRSIMQVHPTHNSLLVRAKMEVMDMLTWVIMAFIYSLALLCSTYINTLAH